MKNFTRFLLLIAVCFIFSIKMNDIIAFSLHPARSGKGDFRANKAGKDPVNGQDSAHPDNPEMNAIMAALRSGDAVDLARYFDSRIDISLPGKSDNYSKKQAEMIMRDFFSLNAIRSFELKHTGENKDGSQFCTGILYTRNGNYRVILFMKPKGKKLFLQQLSFQTVE